MSKTNKVKRHERARTKPPRLGMKARRQRYFSMYREQSFGKGTFLDVPKEAQLTRKDSEIIARWGVAGGGRQARKLARKDKKNWSK